MAPSDEGDSPQCGEMSRSDRGDRRRQRLAAKQTEGEKYLIFCKAILFLSLRQNLRFCHLSTAVSVGASKLTLRDCHRQSAPSSEGG